MTSRIAFIECGGNSAPSFFSAADFRRTCKPCTRSRLLLRMDGRVQLSTLLEETGIDPRAKWFIAEGADAAHVMRSIPLAKALDDAMIVALSERRTIDARQRLPNAPSIARLRRQHEHQVRASHQALARASDELLGIPSLHDAVAERQSLSILFRERSKVLHHKAFPRLGLARTRLLRNLRHRLFREGPNTKVTVSADGGQSWGEAGCRRPCSAWRSRAFACHGDGTEDLRYCKAAHGMKMATCSRRGRNSWPRG